jgi:tellurium resistance protein TerD
MINLTKGQNVRLTKGVQKVKVGLSWDPASDGREWDLDVLAVELDSKDGKSIGDDYLVFYNSVHNTADGKPCDINQSVIHSGDNRTGAGDGDDEVIEVDFSKLDSKCNAILFVINIYDGKSRNQNFGQVKNPKARLYYSDNSIADLVYELDEDYSTGICMEFCMLYKHEGEWKFKALGEDNTNDLAQELNKWGIPTVGNA